MAALVVGEAPGCAVGQAMSVEMVFRDIDAVSLSIFSAPLLAIRGSPPEYPFRPKEKTRAIQL